VVERCSGLKEKTKFVNNQGVLFSTVAQSSESARKGNVRKSGSVAHDGSEGIAAQGSMHSAPNARPTTSVRTEIGARSQAEQEAIDLLIAYRTTRRAELKDRLVMRYSNLVESVARRYAGTGEPIDDLAQEGYIGLISAVDLFDPSKKVKFSTYATHFIIGQIKHYLRDRGKIIKEPAWLQELNQRVSKTTDTLTQELGRTPSHAEVGQAMGIPEENVAELLSTREVFKVGSIHGTTDQDDDASTIDIERQNQSDVAISFQLPVEDRIVLETAMEKLKELEQTVVFAFYFKDRSQTDIARELNISCNYVSHILRNSTKKLKKILASDEVRDRRIKAEAERSQAELRHQNDGLVDPLTRLYNRRYYENRLEEELQRASRTEVELSVLFVQLIGWQGYVRALGTLQADETMIALATTLRKALRRVDIITRYSDDTFSVILPFTGSDADRVAMRVLTATSDCLRKMGLHWGKNALSIQCGWAIAPTDCRQGAELTQYAKDRCAQTQELPLLKAA
jgi:RNA polymerase sigma-B factor